MSTGSQIGYKAETTYGTPVTVDRFIPLLGVGGDIYDKEIIVSDAVRAGRFLRSPGDEAFGSETVSFDVQHELYRDGMGFLLNHIFGDGLTTTGAGPYSHEFLPATHVGMGMTVQIGIDEVDGTVNPFTMAGCKAESAQFSLSVGEIAQLGINWVGKSFADDTALATASYPDTLPYSFIDGSITYDSGALCVTQATLDFNNNLKTDRRCIGSGLIEEPVGIGYRDYVGTLALEAYDGTTLYDAWVDGDVAVLELVLSNGADSLTFSGEVKFRGGMPSVNVSDLSGQSIPFEWLSDTDDETALTVTYVSGDATP